MKILHILDHSIPIHSGYTFRTRAILEQQRSYGWETCHLTSFKHSQFAKSEKLLEEVDGLLFYRTVDHSKLLAKLPILDQIAIIRSLDRRLREVIEIVQPDILHAHSPALNGVAAIRAGKRFGLPVVYEIRAFWEDAAVDHGTSRENQLRYRLTRAMETYVVKRVNAVTTICEGLRLDIAKRGVPQSKITVIPNAVDIDKFTKGQEKDIELMGEIGVKGRFVLGFIGSFYAYEGLSLLLKAMPLILRSIPDCSLLLVGGGPEEQALKRMAIEMDLSKQVIFTGRVPHAEVSQYYGLVDLFVYPRLPMRLTNLVTPLKPLEAMAQEKPVLASDVGGHKELISDGVNGILFEAGNKEDLAQKIIQIKADREKLGKMIEAGRNYVERERNWDVSVSCYKHVYSQAMASEV